jgi:hypothetical protein
MSATKRFNLTHADLDRALACAKLPGLELLIMTIAREESYTKARTRRLRDPLPFGLNISRLSRDFGVDRTRLGFAKDRLINDGLLIDRGDGTYLIDKRYERWAGSHALSQLQLARVREAAVHDDQVEDLEPAPAEPPAPPALLSAEAQRAESLKPGQGWGVWAQQWIDAGDDPGRVLAAVEVAISKRKDHGYALGVLRNSRNKPAPASPSKPRPKRPEDEIFVADPEFREQYQKRHGKRP